MEANDTPEAKRSKRVEMPEPHNFVADWFFRIPIPAFLSAFDITLTERARTERSSEGLKVRNAWYVWSQSSPPEFSFAVGDIFYAPPCEPTVWREQLQRLRWAVQVIGVTTDDLKIAVKQFRENLSSDLEVSSSELGGFLKTGQLLPHFDFRETLEKAD